MAFAGFLEAKPITVTGDVGCGVVAAAAGEGVQSIARPASPLFSERCKILNSVRASNLA